MIRVMKYFLSFNDDFYEGGAQNERVTVLFGVFYKKLREAAPFGIIRDWFSKTIIA